MFSFHKPKVYRSTTGCCICKAKSSSSRFTDSKRYEEDFFPCFLLEERRSGEICNACVLLVKRWKKLPADSDRNWSHVVDARAGPGIKSLTKFKSKNKKKPVGKAAKKKPATKKDQEREPSPSTSEDMIVENESAGAGSKDSSRVGTPDESSIAAILRRLYGADYSDDKDDGFIDKTYFKRVKVCCGVVYRGPYGEVAIDPSLMKWCTAPCAFRKGHQQLRTSTSPFDNSSSSSLPSTSPAHSSSAASSPAHSVDSTPEATKTVGKGFSDSSSDSGYDESSNSGVGESRNKMNKPANKVPTIKSIEIIKLAATTTTTTETVRLTSQLPIELVPIQQVENFTSQSLSSLVNTQTVTNPLVDFAIHATRLAVPN